MQVRPTWVSRGGTRAVHVVAKVWGVRAVDKMQRRLGIRGLHVPCMLLSQSRYKRDGMSGRPMGWRKGR